eukprot:ANDGO_02976.mRNA.1 Alpha-galactosidase 2
MLARSDCGIPRVDALLVCLFVVIVGLCFHGCDSALIRPAVPPMGWNTWCTDDVCGLLDFCRESEIHSIAKALVDQKMTAVGYKMIALDDCWAAQNRTGRGEVTWDPKRFPSGIPALADYLHGLGLQLGIYLCSGTKTCKGNRPGSWGYYDVDTRTMANWRVDMIKLDYCHHPSGFTPQQLYSNFSHWIDVSGRDMMFSTCEWGEGQPWTTFPEFATMIRATHDHIPLFDYDLQEGKNGIGTKQVIEQFGDSDIATYSRPGAFLDADFLETLFPTFSYEESVTEFSFWSLFSSPLLVATDIRNMDAAKKSILMNTEVIAVNQDPIVTGGKRIVNGTDGGQVWTKLLSDGSVAVILYNSNSKFDAKAVSVTVKWPQIPNTGWTTADTIQVRDLWAHKDLGSIATGLTFSIEPKSVRMFRCTLKH